jgi:hypothetical protein
MPSAGPEWSTGSITVSAQRAQRVLTPASCQLERFCTCGGYLHQLVSPVTRASTSMVGLESAIQPGFDFGLVKRPCPSNRAFFIVGRWRMFEVIAANRTFVRRDAQHSFSPTSPTIIVPGRMALVAIGGSVNRTNAYPLETTLLCVTLTTPSILCQLPPRSLEGHS